MTIRSARFPSSPYSRTALAIATLTGLASLLGHSAQAQDAAYPYAGIAVGQSHANLDEESIVRRQTSGSAVPLGITDISRGDKDTGYRVFLGYQFNRMIGLEASFFDLGRYNLQATTTPAGTLNGQLKVQGGGLDLVGTIPLGERFGVLLRGGGQYTKSRGNFTSSGAVPLINATPSDRKFDYKLGAGAQFIVSPNFIVRAEADQYRVSNALDGHARIRVYSVSAVIPFGAGAGRTRAALVPAAYQAPMAAAAPAPMMAAPMAPPAPAPVARAEPAPPVVVAVVVPQAPAPVPMPRRVSFSAESLFGFDVSALSAEGKTALDGFARELKGTQFEVIVVEGHTDRLGSKAYNQTLSLQRADAVKAYLVSSGGFDTNRITTNGKGEDDPSTAAADCKASLGTSALRKCLAPDRRVDIAVTGTQP